jgi:peptidyl-prolyl cis-trans isomerase SDCCAG10
MHNSLFFITLEPNINVNRDKHTIFGKVVGDTIYNLIKANDYEVDADEKPLFPPLIERAEVLDNPFPDCKARTHPPWKPKVRVDVCVCVCVCASCVVSAPLMVSCHTGG